MRVNYVNNTKLSPFTADARNRARIAESGTQYNSLLLAEKIINRYVPCLEVIWQMRTDTPDCAFR